MTNQEKIEFLGARIWSVQTWLESHGRHSRKPRPEFNIEQQERNLAGLESIISDYQQRAAQ
jgi:predicted transcriptional regulator